MAPGVGAGEGLVGQEHRLAGDAGEALHEDLARLGRAHGQEDRPGVRVAAGEAVGERQGVEVERVEDAVEHRPPERALLPVPGVLGDVGDVRNLLDEDDAVHVLTVRGTGHRADRPHGHEIRVERPPAGSPGPSGPRPGARRGGGSGRELRAARDVRPRRLRRAARPPRGRQLGRVGGAGSAGPPACVRGVQSERGADHRGLRAERRGGRGGGEARPDACPRPRPRAARPGHRLLVHGAVDLTDRRSRRRSPGRGSARGRSSWRPPTSLPSLPPSA